MDRRRFLSLSLLLSGCGGGGGPQQTPTPQAEYIPPLYKDSSIFVQQGWETALVVFKGELLALTFERDLNSFLPIRMTVRRWTGEVVAQHPVSFCMACAVVKDGAIHVLGTTFVQNGVNSVVHSVLDVATFAPSAPQVVLSMDASLGSATFANTDVTEDPNGYRMVIETTAGVFFARSADLDAWVWDGGQFNAGQYVGCPSIHYVSGAHYLTWLSTDGKGHYSTKVAKSADDCRTFTYGRDLLAPLPDEGINNSDADLIEFQGRVYGVYIDGDQATYGRLHKFTYDGPLAQMFSDFM